MTNGISPSANREKNNGVRPTQLPPGAQDLQLSLLMLVEKDSLGKKIKTHA
jgi:hypothetical protein